VLLLWTLLLGLLLPASVAADAGGEAAVCDEEPALSDAAAELLLAGVPPTPESLMRAVRAAGSDAVGVRAYLWQAADAGADANAWLAAYARKADARVVCGRAQGASSGMLLVAARAGSLEPLAGNGARVRGSVSDRFRDPELVVADGYGDLQRIAVDRAQLARGIPIADDLARPARVQLLARGPLGPRPIAERVLAAFDGASLETSDPLAHDTAGGSAGRTVAELVDQLRAQAGRPALRSNTLLARVAKAHAEHVCARGQIAHQLAPGDDPKQRLQAVGVSARRVGETVARAEDAAGAFVAFEHSPSHRFTLLESGFTDAGTGEAKDEQGRTCVVVLLAEWPRFVGR
jgi:hypothetical protein